MKDFESARQWKIKVRQMLLSSNCSQLLENDSKSLETYLSAAGYVLGLVYFLNVIALG